MKQSTFYTPGPSAALESAELRGQFPILKRTMRGKRFAYLDNSATSLKPEAVISAEQHYYTELSANIHRGVYEFSEQATVEYDAAREKVARFIGAGRDGSVVFTKGTTESVNLVAYGWARKFFGPGDEIVTTEIEHHANLVPWQEACKATGATLRFIPVASDGSLLLERLEEVIGERTKLVAVTAMSNVTGYMPDLRLIIEAAHLHGVPVLVDGAQYVSHHPIDVTSLDCDFLVFSAHKMCGPTGVGVLYAKNELLEQMDPLIYGGDMVSRVSREQATYKPLPDKFEGGTPNIAGVIALGAAVDFLSEIGMQRISEHERNLLEYMAQRAAEVDGLVSYGPEDLSLRGGIYSFNYRDVHPHDAGALLDQEGVAVRTGFHCAQPLMKVFGVTGTVRASFYLYNTTADIDALIAGLARIRDVFG